MNEQQEIDSHLLWVGKCINQWALLEGCLFELFQLTLGTRPDFAAIIFYRDHNFGGKLKLTEELVEATLPDQRSKREWEQLCKKIKDKSEYRNRAAHIPLRRDQTVIVGPEGVVVREDTGIVSKKSEARLRRSSEKQKTVTISELQASVRAANELIRALTARVQLLK